MTAKYEDKLSSLATLKAVTTRTALSKSRNNNSLCLSNTRRNLSNGVKINLKNTKKAIILAYTPASYQLFPNTRANKNGAKRSRINKGMSPTISNLLMSLFINSFNLFGSFFPALAASAYSTSVIDVPISTMGRLTTELANP